MTYFRTGSLLMTAVFFITAGVIRQKAGNRLGDSELVIPAFVFYVPAISFFLTGFYGVIPFGAAYYVAGRPAVFAFGKQRLKKRSGVDDILASICLTAPVFTVLPVFEHNLAFEWYLSLFVASVFICMIKSDRLSYDSKRPADNQYTDSVFRLFAGLWIVLELSVIVLKSRLIETDLIPSQLNYFVLRLPDLSIIASGLMGVWLFYYEAVRCRGKTISTVHSNPIQNATVKRSYEVLHETDPTASGMLVDNMIYLSAVGLAHQVKNTANNIGHVGSDCYDRLAGMIERSHQVKPAKQTLICTQREVLLMMEATRSLNEGTDRILGLLSPKSDRRPKCDQEFEDYFEMFKTLGKIACVARGTSFVILNRDLMRTSVPGMTVLLILLNLVDNAAKASAIGKKVTVEFRPIGKGDGSNETHVTVSNTPMEPASHTTKVMVEYESVLRSDSGRLDDLNDLVGDGRGGRGLRLSRELLLRFNGRIETDISNYRTAITAVFPGVR